MWILKILIFLWPFVKEMVLGDKSIKEAIKTNKIRTLAVLIILMSLGLNFFAVQRLVVITQEHLEMKKRCDEEPKPPNAKVPEALKQPKAPSIPETVNDERYRRLMEQYNKMKQREKEDPFAYGYFPSSSMKLAQSETEK